MSKIILKKSSVPAKVPVAGDFEYGELAINYNDGIVYYKKSDNTVDAISKASTAPIVDELSQFIGTSNFQSNIGDQYFNNVALLLHGNTTDISYYGLTKDTGVSGLNTSPVKTKFATTSIRLDGTSGLAFAANSLWNPAGGDYTVEFWLNLDSLPTAAYTTLISNYGTPATGWGIGILPNGVVGANLSGDGTDIISAASTIVANEWQHIALTIQSGTVRIFCNGSLVVSFTGSLSTDTSGYRLSIGGLYYQGSWVQSALGYLEDLRITKGIARYTSAFTAPTQALPSGTTTTATTLSALLNTKQDLLVSGTTIKTINGTSLLGSGDITITGGSGSGSGDMLKSTYDTNNDGIVDRAHLADSVAWNTITGTPTTFTPSSHTHVISDVTGLQSALDGKQASFTVQNANYVYAGPASGSAVPTFRALLAADIPVLNQNTTGSAATLTTSRSIYGNSFNGSLDLNQVIASTYGGTGNGFVKFLGPASSEKTFTLPNSSATILTSANPVTIAQGGHGQSTSTAGFNALSPLTTKGDLVVFNGTNNIRLPVGSDNLYLAADSTSATGLSWKSTITDPVVYTANSITLTDGVYVSGTVANIQTYNDGTFYQITDGTAAGPAWVITVTFTGVSSFNRVVANIDYTQNSGHTIYFQVYNNTYSTWDNLGSYSGAAGYTQYALAVLNDASYINAGNVQARIYHSNAGNSAHTTKLEYFALEQTTSGSQGPRGPSGTTGAGLIAGGSTGQYLRKSSTTDYDTAWNNITISEVTSLQSTLDGKEATGVASGLITTHESAVDPHPQYTTMMEVATASGDIHGVVDRTASIISFTDATRTFTISPVGANWTFYYKGTLYTVSTSKSIVITNTSGARFIYIDPTTLNLVEGSSVPDFANNVNLAYIYWDSVNAKSLIAGDERHGSTRDTTWHTAQHTNVGTVWRSGGGLSYTLNDPSSVVLTVGTPLVVADEDLVHTINHSAAPSANYEQILNSASLEVLYLDGSTYVSTAQSTTPWIGGTDVSASVLFDGNGDYVTVPSNSGYAFGTSNFTVEFWINIAGAGDHTGQHIFQTRDGINNGILIQYDRTNKYISATADTGFTAITTATNSILDNTWYHVAVVRNGSTAYVYINGTQAASGGITSNITGTTPYISRRYASDGALHYVNGYVSNLRVVNGSAVYTGAFTPSTSRLLPITGTTLLVFQDNTFKDNSVNNFTISTFGNTAISAQSPFTSVTLARYNYIVNGIGSLATASEGSYITYWMLVTNDIKRPVKLVLGRNVYTTLDSAYSEDFTEYGLSFAEQVFMYQIVVQTSTTYTQNTGRVKLVGVRKILSKVTSTAATVSATNHSNLTGLQNSDSHPISAITNLQTTLDAKQVTLVSGTNIKTINSTTILGSGNIVVQPTLVSGTNIKTLNGNSLLGSGDIVISGGSGSSITLGQVVALSNGMAMP